MTPDLLDAPPLKIMTPNANGGTFTGTATGIYSPPAGTQTITCTFSAASASLSNIPGNVQKDGKGNWTATFVIILQGPTSGSDGVVKASDSNGNTDQKTNLNWNLSGHALEVTAADARTSS